MCGLMSHKPRRVGDWYVSLSLPPGLRRTEGWGFEADNANGAFTADVLEFQVNSPNLLSTTFHLLPHY